jgi:hypothetical protein
MVSSNTLTLPLPYGHNVPKWRGEKGIKKRPRVFNP